MQFTRVILGWIAVSLVFLAADRLRGRRMGARDAPRWLPFAEALPFTLLMALWFGSLGSGMWPLVLGLLALAIEAPARLGEIGKGDRPGRALVRAVPTIAKLMVGGIALRLIL